MRRQKVLDQIGSIDMLSRVSGGELFDYVSAKECLGEAEAAAFIQQILFAIKHLHHNHIVHLDIKVVLLDLSRVSLFKNCGNLDLLDIFDL